MRTITILARWLAVFVAGVALAQASDPTAVYARVDKVVLAPNADSPETIQVSGVFALAKPNDRNDYLAPARGYLYFKLAQNPEAARKEWADLKDVAGTRQIVAFGSRYDAAARLRKAEERPENPDAFSINIGLQKISGRTEYAPIRGLQDYKD